MKRKTFIKCLMSAFSRNDAVQIADRIKGADRRELREIFRQVNHLFDIFETEEILDGLFASMSKKLGV